MTTSRQYRFTDDRDRITMNVDVDPVTDCWVWLHALRDTGYGMIYDPRTRRSGSAHRYSYELFVGPIPEGLQLDHLCRNRACVNPEHLEPVTSRVNTWRAPEAVAVKNGTKTHCKHGHEFTPENTYVTRRGQRQCCECRRRLVREHYARQRANRAA